LVHGQSPLRTEIVAEDELDEEEPEDGAERLIRMIDAKYRPQTLQGQSSIGPVHQEETKCPDECLYKINKFSNEEENDPWISNHPYLDKHQRTLSEPSTLFDGVADLYDDAGIESVVPQGNTMPLMSQDALLRVQQVLFLVTTKADRVQILNTFHNDFVDHYVQRQQARIEQAIRAKRASADTGRAIAPTRSDVEVLEVAKNTIVVGDPSPVSYAPSVLEPTSAFLREGMPLIRTILTGHRMTEVDISFRPVSALISRPSRDGSSLHTSVFSKGMSVITKPSNESSGSDYLQLVDTIDHLKVDSHT
jgi:hypothetical protein